MKRYTKNCRTLHISRFLNQKELSAKEYAEKEGINLNTFRGWLADATSPSPRSHKAKTAFAAKRNKYEYIMIGYSVLVTLVLLVAIVY